MTGWIIAFVVGLLVWLVIAELWGAVVIIVLLSFGVLLVATAARLLGGEIPSGGDEP